MSNQVTGEFNKVFGGIGIDMDDESTNCSISELRPRREHVDDKLTNCSSKLSTLSKSDE
jgi:hypothetical protein